MNYKKVYDELMLSRLDRVCNDDFYYEKHHIIPKSLGGTNKKDNLVKLTPKEHFLAHMPSLSQNRGRFGNVSLAF